MNLNYDPNKKQILEEIEMAFIFIVDQHVAPGKRKNQNEEIFIKDKN